MNMMGAWYTTLRHFLGRCSNSARSTLPHRNGLRKQKQERYSAAGRADIGTLGRIILLREFDTQQALMEERRRALLSSNPFNGNGIVGQHSQETYEASLSCLPPNLVWREAFTSFGLIF